MAAEPNPTNLSALRIGSSSSAGYPLFGAFTSPSYTYTVVPSTLSLVGLAAAQQTVTGATFTLTSTGAVSIGAVRMSYDGTVVTSSAGYTAPVTTSPATAFTGDVRGTYALQSAANGIKRFVATIWLVDPNTTTANYGVAQA